MHLESSSRFAPLAHPSGLTHFACLVLAGAASLASSKAIADAVPVGPPWTDVCAPMEHASFRQIFTSDQCQRDFDAAFATLDVTGTRAWMSDHRLCFKEWDHFSWLAFLKHDSKMARLAWEHQLELARERLEEADVVALLERGTTQEISPEAVAHTRSFLDQVELDQSFKDEMDQAQAAVTPICLYHLDPQCISAMNKALGWMYPRSYKVPGPPVQWFTFSMLPEFRSVFSDTETQRSASRLALEARRLVETAPDERLDADDLYSLGLRAFNGDADRFWRFMIVYATRGAAWATASKLAHQDTKPLFAAFMVLSAAMGVLDTDAMASGSPWSYGPGAHSTCFQPKPYHYWMSAGYAYLLRREGYGERTARLVSRLLGAMYELGSTTMDRDPTAVFFVPTFDTIVNRARRELTHHYLGAEFGLAAGSAAPTQDFDATFLEIMEASEPLPVLSDEEMATRIADNQTKWSYWTKLTGYYFHRD
jgi:hypothetical protein